MRRAEGVLFEGHCAKVIEDVSQVEHIALQVGVAVIERRRAFEL
jgi:hypothetical protein